MKLDSEDGYLFTSFVRGVFNVYLTLSNMGKYLI